MGSTGWSQMCRYTEAEVGRYAPHAGGVYRLMYAQEGKSHVFYVGQSGDLADRLIAHLGAAEQNTCIRRHLRDYTCYFDFVRVSPESERLRVEADTIRQWRPTCNA